MDLHLINLRNQFRKHHEESIKLNETLMSQFISANPGEEIPSHFTEEFSLPLALSEMIDEIMLLRQEIEELYKMKEIEDLK